MTTTQSCTPTMTQIRRVGKPPLSIWYDFTVSGTWILPRADLLRSLIDPAIRQWWDSLTNAQKSALPAQPLSLKILASNQAPIPLQD